MLARTSMHWLSVVCIALVVMAPAAFAEDTATGETAAAKPKAPPLLDPKCTFEQVVAWAKSNGGVVGNITLTTFLQENVTVHPEWLDSNYGTRTSWVSVSKFLEGDELLSIDVDKLAMSPGSAKKTALGPVFEKMKLNEVQQLALHLLYEAHNPKSFWKPYICSLPANVPLFMTLEESNGLPEEQMKHLARLRYYMRADFNAIFPFLRAEFPNIFPANKINIEQWAWALSIVDHFGFTLPDTDEHFIEMQASDNKHVLLPLLDSINIKSMNHAVALRWLSRPTHPVRHAAIVAAEDFRKGTEVFLELPWRGPMLHPTEHNETTSKAAELGPPGIGGGKVDDLLDWSRKHGAKIAPMKEAKFVLEGHQDGDMWWLKEDTVRNGLMAMDHIKENETIVQIPLDPICLSRHSIEKGDTVSAKILRNHPHLPPETQPILSLALLLEAIHVQDSFWKPYFAVLNRRVKLPMVWDDDSLADESSADLELVAEAHNQRWALRAEWNAIMPTLMLDHPELFGEDKINFKSWVWANAQVFSRSWLHQYPAKDGQEGEKLQLICPVIDSFNHMEGASEVDFHARGSKEGKKTAQVDTAVLHSHSDIPRGAEIMTSYGIKSLLTLKTDYGFRPAILADHHLGDPDEDFAEEWDQEGLAPDEPGAPDGEEYEEGMTGYHDSPDEQHPTGVSAEALTEDEVHSDEDDAGDEVEEEHHDHDATEL